MSVWSPNRAVAGVLIRQQERRLQRFLKQTSKAAQIQRDLLLAKIRYCAKSDFGRKHGFSSIHNAKDFRRQVPISQYDYYLPYIERVARGDVKAMFPDGERIIMFTLTSGTTGEPKLIPVTKNWLKEFKASWNLWGLKAFVDHPDGILTKIVSIVGNWDMRRTEANIPCGLASGLSTKYQHPFVRRYYSIPSDVFSIEDATSRYYTMLRLTLPDNVGLFITSTPATVVRFAQLGDEYREQLVRDIADGTLSQDISVSSDLRSSLQKRFRKANPTRATELERIIQRTGHLYPKDYWNLSLVACWLGGTVAGNAHQIPDYYGETARRDIGLISSEGRHTVPLDDNRPEGVLAFNHHYYEFIPAAEIHARNPTLLECHELEVGEKYFILMTTSSGLYRYNIYDLVQCNGYVGQAPIIEFLHKGGRISDMEGEKISERHVVKAVMHASTELGISVSSFTAIPLRPRNEPPYYGFMVEAKDVNNQGIAQRLLRGIDRWLMSHVAIYQTKRHDGYLGTPRLIRIPAGSWDRYRQSEVQRRKVGEEQYKHPCLALDPGFVNQFSAIDTVSLPETRTNRVPLPYFPQGADADRNAVA